MILWFAVLILPFGGWSGQSLAAKPADKSVTDISELQRTAETGDPQAEFALGQAYEFGDGIAQSDDAACSWYRKAAEQGYAAAQNAVGVMYRAGRGVEQSKGEALQWYRKAAKQMYSKAMFNLGTAYYNGDGVAIDDVLAYAWFLVAKEYGSEPAREAVNRMQNSVLQWQFSAALEAVGDMFGQGTDLAQDHKAALDWYRKAAQLGETSADMKLAKYLVDQGGDKNYSEARHFCEEAAKKLDSAGALCVGLLHQKGLGTPQNLPEAVRWFKQSAQLGNAQATLRLAELYWDGSGVKQDRVTAYGFVILAATADLPKAQQDKTLYEQALSSKELEKGRRFAVDWAKAHPTMGLRHRTVP